MHIRARLGLQHGWLSISTLSGMTRLSPDLLPPVKTGQESDIPQTIFNFKTTVQVLAPISISLFRRRRPVATNNKIRINRVD
jgi:hypothetical protein